MTARIWRVLGATLILVLWDVTLDPAMSHTTPFWVWEQPGRYYGMPWLNIAGWCLTGLVIMLVFELCPGVKAMQRLPFGFLAAIYLSNMILPIGLLAAVGAWLPIALTLLFALVIWGLSRIAAGGKQALRQSGYSYSLGN